MTTGKKNRGIHLRSLQVAVVMVVLITSHTILGVILLRGAQGDARVALTQKGRSLAKTLGAQAELGVLVGDSPSLEALLDGLRFDPDVAFASIEDSQGGVLATGPKGVGIHHRRGEEAIRTLGAMSSDLEGGAGEATRGGEILTRDVEVKGETYWVVQAPIYTLKGGGFGEAGLLGGQGASQGEAEDIGTLTLALSEARLGEARRANIITLLLVTALALALGLLLAIPLSAIISRPLDRLAAASGRLAKGEFAPDLTHDRLAPREVGALNHAFQDMAEALGDRDRRLQENAALLEAQADDLRTNAEALEEKNQRLALSATQLETSNTELVRVSQLKSAFLANMSHELRTPLNSIIGYTELMIEGGDGPINEDQQDSLERVLRNGRHLLGLITEVLDLSKVESGGVVLNIQPVDLRAIAEDCLEMVTPMARERSLGLRLEAEAGAVMALGDDIRVKQVLVNLLGNAVKFTDEGAVSVILRRGAGRVWAEVKDTGRGIPEDALDSVFEEFRQVKGSGPGGTGLGLPIARRLVEAMGGEMDVASVEGEGSTFVFWLPGGPSLGAA